MLDWLKDSPGFPVSQNPDNQNRGAENPHGYTVSPVSRFSRFENKGAAQQQDETANACEKNAPPVSQPLPELLCAVAARLTPATPDELQAQASANPERLAAPPSPREAEARRGAVLGADGGKLPRPESLTVTRQKLQTGNHIQPGTGPPGPFYGRVIRASLFR